MDHDRSEGEGGAPTEYTGIKMEVVEWSKAAKDILGTIAEGKKVFFVAATLRPETMSVDFILFGIAAPDLATGMARQTAISALLWSMVFGLQMTRRSMSARTVPRAIWLSRASSNRKANPRS
jgi:hypothetical protein